MIGAVVISKHAGINHAESQHYGHHMATFFRTAPLFKSHFCWQWPFTGVLVGFVRSRLSRLFLSYSNT